MIRRNACVFMFLAFVFSCGDDAVESDVSSVTTAMTQESSNASATTSDTTEESSGTDHEGELEIQLTLICEDCSGVYWLYWFWENDFETPFPCAVISGDDEIIDSMIEWILVQGTQTFHTVYFEIDVKTVFLLVFNDLDEDGIFDWDVPEAFTIHPILLVPEEEDDLIIETTLSLLPLVCEGSEESSGGTEEESTAKSEDTEEETEDVSSGGATSEVSEETTDDTQGGTDESGTDSVIKITINVPSGYSPTEMVSEFGPHGWSGEPPVVGTGQITVFEGELSVTSCASQPSSENCEFTLAFKNKAVWLIRWQDDGDGVVAEDECHFEREDFDLKIYRDGTLISSTFGPNKQPVADSCNVWFRWP